MLKLKIIYSRRDLRETFGVTAYALEKMIADGTLEQPFNKGKNEHPRWTESQISRCRQKLYEQSLPPVPSGKPAFKFSKKREARILASAL